MAEVEFQTQYGPVGVSLADGGDYGNQNVSRVQELIAAGMSLSDSLAVIRPLAQAVLAQVSGLATAVETVTAEFGLELGGKGRFIVAEAEAKASIKVTLTWKPGAP